MSEPAASTWPEPYQAAVTLTYDDALDVHLDAVAAQLEAAGLRATFYTPINADGMLRRPDDWIALARRGHELGNHSIFHPCRRDAPDQHPWLDDGYNLARYTPRRWRHEMRVASFVLHLLDGRTERTFGNTCCDTTLGPAEHPASLDPLIDELFVAGRGPFNRRIVDPRRANLNALGHFGGDQRTCADLQAEVEQARETGGWIIYMIHGVGEGTHKLFIDADEHRRFIDWLGEQRRTLWVAPMVEIARHLRHQRLDDPAPGR